MSGNQPVSRILKISKPTPTTPEEPLSQITTTEPDKLQLR
jgi:hypothetical protein